MALKATGSTLSELGAPGGFEQKDRLTCILTLSLWLLCREGMCVDKGRSGDSSEATSAVSEPGEDRLDKEPRRQ